LPAESGLSKGEAFEETVLVHVNMLSYMGHCMHFKYLKIPKKGEKTGPGSPGRRGILLTDTVL
jgi:hypothetical protein